MFPAGTCEIPIWWIPFFRSTLRTSDRFRPFRLMNDLSFSRRLGCFALWNMNSRTSNQTLFTRPSGGSRFSGREYLLFSGSLPRLKPDGGIFLPCPSLQNSLDRSSEYVVARSKISLSIDQDDMLTGVHWFDLWTPLRGQPSNWNHSVQLSCFHSGIQLSEDLVKLHFGI